MIYRGECPYTIKEEFKNEYKEVCYKAQRLGIVVKQFGPYNFQLPTPIRYARYSHSRRNV